MNIAIMQPYLFPYLGYFQLIFQSDIFVLYDDAAFIKQGYINRNTLLNDGKPARFTVPVPGASSNKKIGELSFGKDVEKILKMLQQHYHKATYFQQVMPLVESVLNNEERDITACCQLAIEKILAYLGLTRTLIRASSLNYNRSLDAQGKVVAICQALGGNIYTNSAGGQHLYQHVAFDQHGLLLQFIKSNLPHYQQNLPEFVPGLSIIDMLMHAAPADIITALSDFTLWRTSEEVFDGV